MCSSAVINGNNGKKKKKGVTADYYQGLVLDDVLKTTHMSIIITMSGKFTL